MLPKAKLQDVAIDRQVGIGVVVEHRPESLGRLQEKVACLRHWILNGSLTSLKLYAGVDAEFVQTIHLRIFFRCTVAT